MLQTNIGIGLVVKHVTKKKKKLAECNVVESQQVGSTGRCTPPAAVSVGGCMGKSNGNQYIRGIVTDQNQVDGLKNSSEAPSAKNMLANPLHALRTTKVQRRNQIFEQRIRNSNS